LPSHSEAGAHERIGQLPERVDFLQFPVTECRHDIPDGGCRLRAAIFIGCVLTRANFMAAAVTLALAVTARSDE